MHLPVCQAWVDGVTRRVHRMSPSARLLHCPDVKPSQTGTGLSRTGLGRVTARYLAAALKSQPTNTQHGLHRPCTYQPLMRSACLTH